MRPTSHAYAEWWEKWINEADQEAGDRLLEAYMPLVHYHVQRVGATLPKNVSQEEMFSHGMMGLYDAMRKFDLSRELKFDTYASIRIRGAIMDGLRKEDWLPRTVREKSKKIEETMSQLEQTYGRFVTEEEVAEKLNMSEEEVRRVMNETFFANLLSIHEETPEGEKEETFQSTIQDANTLTPEEETLKANLLEELAEAIENLNEKEQMVLSLFYQEELTLTEIGHVMNLSVSRISQIHSKALFRLQQILKKRW